MRWMRRNSSAASTSTATWWIDERYDEAERERLARARWSVTAASCAAACWRSAGCARSACATPRSTSTSASEYDPDREVPDDVFAAEVDDEELADVLAAPPRRKVQRRYTVEEIAALARGA